MIKSLKLKRLLKGILLIVIVVVIVTLFSSNKKPNSFSFDSFDNITGVPYKIIPNTVHYVMFGSTSLNFISFISLVSVIKWEDAFCQKDNLNSRPKGAASCWQDEDPCTKVLPEEPSRKIQQSNVWIHCDCTELSGHYWSLIVSLSSLLQVPVKVSFMNRPTHVYGQPLSSVYHSSDIARIQILMESGGVYLDTDMVLLKPLDQYLHYEMVVGWPHDEYFGNQIMIGHPKARFLKKYLESYRRYLPREWYYNGGQMPTEQILMKEPHLVHRVPLLFGVHNLVDRLYGPKPWNAWRQYHAIHLLSRHHEDPERLNETTILQYDRPFGEVVRWILYQVKPILNSSKGTWDEDLGL